jgi:hypothetical protein
LLLHPEDGAEASYLSTPAHSDTLQKALLIIATVDIATNLTFIREVTSDFEEIVERYGGHKDISSYILQALW